MGFRSEIRATWRVGTRARWLGLCAALTGALLPCSGCSDAPRDSANPAAAPAQRTFATPEAAGQALILAAEKFDVPALTAILGADDVDLVVTKDEVQDRKQSAAFAAEAREKMEVVRDPQDPALATLSVGNDDWPLPIPIVKEGESWRFDTQAGRQELLFRRIGRNELDAIEICHGYVEAQQEYALKKHDGSPVNEYARRIISTPGKQDGLAWLTADGRLEGPISEGIARAIAEGYTERYEPYHGYFFKVLIGQGSAAPLGDIDFMVDGVMIGGFALVAPPADYLVSGVKTFIVSHDGVVYEKDLGPETLEAFRGMERYNPDETWTPTSVP